MFDNYCNQPLFPLLIKQFPTNLEGTLGTIEDSGTINEAPKTITKTGTIKNSKITIEHKGTINDTKGTIEDTGSLNWSETVDKYNGKIDISRTLIGPGKIMGNTGRILYRNLSRITGLKGSRNLQPNNLSRGWISALEQLEQRIKTIISKNKCFIITKMMLWILIINYLIPVASAADDTVRTTAAAVLQEQARLPCDVRSSLPKDRPVLILWYRDAAGTPIYSFDARGSSIDIGKHWADENLLGKRAYFQLIGAGAHHQAWNKEHVSATSRSYVSSEQLLGGAYLELLPVQEKDEAVYRCRVDFLLSPTRNTLVNFTVVVPPGPPQIFNATEHLVGGGAGGASIIGPYNEGSTLVLNCNVAGGRPPPSVRWFVNDRPFQSDSVRLPGGIVRSSLAVQRLSRKDLHAVFECRASNFNRSTPISSTVTLDMNFQPLNVSIRNRGAALSSGSDYELVCETWGSRPAAVITWWKGGTLQMKDAKMSTSHDNNVTTSVLRYRSKMSDNQKYLTCRAENSLIAGSAKEDGVQLNIHYRPVVTLQMGSNLDPKNIKEGDDVYFECHINANPEVKHVLWLHNGVDVYHDVVRGIILQNQTLVLQRIERRAGGLYTCRAINSEGEGESNAVALNVMYKPYCKRQHQTIYGTALHEAATVTCEVEARPGPVTFRWTFNNTSEHVPISASSVVSQDFTSIASYAPKSHLDYGTLLCWAFNSIGEQSSPCAFAIIPAGPPDSPENCSIANQSAEAIQVECSSGFNGGLPQTFYMEVYDSTTALTLYRNISSSSPSFLLHSLKPGLALLMVTYAANSKGRSKTAKLETLTLKVAEKRTSPPSIWEMTPVVALIIGIVAVLLLTALVIFVAMKLRRPHEVAEGPSAPLNEGIGPQGEDKHLGSRGDPLSRYKEETPLRDVMMGETEDVNPDVIPQEKVAYEEYSGYNSQSKIINEQVSKMTDNRAYNNQQRSYDYGGSQQDYSVSDQQLQLEGEGPTSSAPIQRLPSEYGTMCIRRNQVPMSPPGRSSDLRLYATMDCRQKTYSSKAYSRNSSYEAPFMQPNEQSDVTASISSSPVRIKYSGIDQPFYDIRSTARTPLLNPSESIV